MEIKLIKKISMKSRSKPGVMRTAELWSDGTISCDCEARDNIYCYHKRVLLWEIGKELEELRMHKIFDYHEARESVAKRMPPVMG